MKNVILIGMPASGKSTVGVILAKRLAFDFIDTDLIIQRREGRPLDRIIEAEGIERFLEIEAEVCKSLDVDRTVVATGGSAVYSDAGMARLRALGRVILLDVDFDTLRARLSDVRGRGVVLREGQTLEALYAERMPLYRRYADLVIPEGGDALEATAEAVHAACLDLFNSVPSD